MSDGPRFETALPLKTFEDFKRVLSNFEGLAAMIHKSLTASQFIPFYTNDGLVYYASTFYGKQRYFAVERSMPDFKNGWEEDECEIRAIFSENQEMIIGNLANQKMVAKVLEIETSQFIKTIKLYNDNGPYVKIN